MPLDNAAGSVSFLVASFAITVFDCSADPSSCPVSTCDVNSRILCSAISRRISACSLETTSPTDNCEINDFNESTSFIDAFVIISLNFMALSLCVSSFAFAACSRSSGFGLLPLSWPPDGVSGAISIVTPSSSESCVSERFLNVGVNPPASSGTSALAASSSWSSRLLLEVGFLPPTVLSALFDLVFLVEYSLSK